MKQMNKIIVSFFVIALSSCSALPLMQSKPVEVVTIAEPMPMYHPPLPMEVQLVDIDWEILTPEIMQEYLNQIDNGSAPETAFFGSLKTKIFFLFFFTQFLTFVPGSNFFGHPILNLNENLTDAAIRPVSYTHLTLPTSDLV